MKTKLIGSVLAACITLQAGSALARSNYIPRTERGQLAEAIVLRWSTQAAKQYGTTPEGWAKAMAGSLGQAPIEQLRKAASATRLDDVVTTLQFSTGPSSIYRSVTACRIADTRAGGVKLQANHSYQFFGVVSTGGIPDFGAQGGFNSDCGIPANATGLVLSVAALDAEGAGHLSVFPANDPLSPTQDVMYRASGDNSATVVLGDDPSTFMVHSTGTTHAVIDVVGYFAPAAVTQNCFNTAQAAVTVADGSSAILAAPACPGAFQRVSVLCRTTTKHATLLGADSNDQCQFSDTTPNNLTGIGVAASKCCSVAAN